MKGRPCGIMCIAWFRWPSGEKNLCLELFGQSMMLDGRTASVVRLMLAEKRKHRCMQCPLGDQCSLDREERKMDACSVRWETNARWTEEKT